MEQASFLSRVDSAREREPVLFALASERPCTPADLVIAEESLMVELPAKFRWFLERFGAGFFGLTVVYSPLEASEDSIVARQDLPWIDGDSFLPIGDNGTGDYYGFVTANRLATDGVYLLDHETGVVRESPSFGDFLEYLDIVGLGNN